MDQDTRASHSKAPVNLSKVFFCRLLQCYGGHLAELKTVKKRYFAKKKTKQNKTKQNKKKRDEKKTAKLICCGNARLDLWQIFIFII